MPPKKPRSPKVRPPKVGQKRHPGGTQGGLLRAEKGLLPRPQKTQAQNTKHKTPKNKGVFYFRKTRIHHNKNQKTQNPKNPRTKETKDARQLP